MLEQVVSTHSGLDVRALRDSCRIFQRGGTARRLPYGERRAAVHCLNSDSRIGRYFRDVVGEVADLDGRPIVDKAKAYPDGLYKQ
jgi:hypothetical protein